MNLLHINQTAGMSSKASSELASRQILTDEQWVVLAPLIPPAGQRAGDRGSLIGNEDRAVVNGALWVLRMCATWADLPDWYPPYLTCVRRFSQWIKDGTIRRVLEALALDLQSRGGINLPACFVDGTFVVAKKGGARWERPSPADVRSAWPLWTLQVFHSPCTRVLLAHMKSPLSKLPSMRLSLWDGPDDLCGIVPMTMIRSMKNPLAPASIRPPQ